MVFDCAHRARLGAQECLTGCPTRSDVGGFRFARVEHPGDVPPAEPRFVDVALLDMHHGWPNLGHEALVDVIQSAVCDMRATLEAAGLSVRVLSYDVRRGLVLPDAPGGRHAIYIGTGGPGHLDPRRNDGVDAGSQGILEDPAWEAPLFALFDAIRRDPQASLIAICHSFGLMCRWLGVADAVLRGPDRGGKSVGVRYNELLPDAQAHPWFSRFADDLRGGARFPVLDNRLYDLVPSGHTPDGVRVLAVDCNDAGAATDAITMVEAEAGTDGVPRILGVNHHPEIVNRQRQIALLEKKRARGGVNEAWFTERWAVLTEQVEEELDDRLLHLTSQFTLMGPIRAALAREVERKAAAVGIGA